jgi:hypothetical protein
MLSSAGFMGPEASTMGTGAGAAAAGAAGMGAGAGAAAAPSVLRRTLREKPPICGKGGGGACVAWVRAANPAQAAAGCRACHACSAAGCCEEAPDQALPNWAGGPAPAAHTLSSTCATSVSHTLLMKAATCAGRGVRAGGRMRSAGASEEQQGGFAPNGSACTHERRDPRFARPAGALSLLRGLTHLSGAGNDLRAVEELLLLLCGKMGAAWAVSAGKGLQ